MIGIVDATRQLNAHALQLAHVPDLLLHRLSDVSAAQPLAQAAERGALATRVLVLDSSLERRLVLPTRIDTWSLTSLQQRLVKTGGRLVKHARYYWLLLAESHLTRRLFGSMLQRIWALPVPTG